MYRSLSIIWFELVLSMSQGHTPSYAVRLFLISMTIYNMCMHSSLMLVTRLNTDPYQAPATLRTVECYTTFYCQKKWGTKKVGRKQWRKLMVVLPCIVPLFSLTTLESQVQSLKLLKVRIYCSLFKLLYEPVLQVHSVSGLSLLTGLMYWLKFH